MKREAIVCFVFFALFSMSVFPVTDSVRAKVNFTGARAPEPAFRSHLAFMRSAMRGGSFTVPDALPPVYYDEQLGLTFAQNLTSLAYNVTAVQQNDTYGYGPAYLLNGLTDKGYWYQVGFSFDWSYVTPGRAGYYAGFNFNYEVWDNNGKSIFPTSGGGGLSNFSGPVDNGDQVLLRLYFSGGNVVMYAHDWNTSASAEETYTAVGASLFQGLPSETANTNGYFTGLMTEWCHVNAYYSGEARVNYSNTAFALSSGWLWADEYYLINQTTLFSSDKYVSFSSPTQLHYFTTNGAVDAASAYMFITGGTVPLSASISPFSAIMDVGQQQLFASNVTGGASLYMYQWYLNGSAIAGATASTLTFTPSSPGSYTVHVNITDNDGFTAESNIASVTVYPRPSVSVSPSSITMVVSEPQLFASTVLGGISPYTYQWYLNGTAVSRATNATWTFTPTSACHYTVYVKVTDSVGMQATSNVATATSLTHDVAVTNVTRSKSIVGQGYGLTMNVTAANQGDYTETFSVTLYANTTIIATFTNITLTSGNFTTITFTWNTIGFAYGNYTISASVTLDPGETNNGIGSFSYGTVKVTIPGDANGDGVVDAQDFYILQRAWGTSKGQPGYDPRADFNNDGKVDAQDFFILQFHRGQSIP